MSIETPKTCKIVCCVGILMYVYMYSLFQFISKYPTTRHYIAYFYDQMKNIAVIVTF